MMNDDDDDCNYCDSRNILLMAVCLFETINQRMMVQPLSGDRVCYLQVALLLETKIHVVY